MRIGQGFDVHAFGPGDHITVGGVKIPHTHGVVAHSDGDVALHALCDALLGAAGLGDIGHFYPPDDPKFQNMDSREFLRDVFEKVKAHAYQVGNVDITLVAEAPKMAPHRSAMQDIIAQILGVESRCVNIKATTTEKMGYIGEKQGLAAFAVVLLKDVKS